MASLISNFLRFLIDPDFPQSASMSSEGESREYFPSSPRDVYHAAWVLQHYLPWELVVYTLDLAEHWPRLIAKNDNEQAVTEWTSPSVRAKLPIETFNTARPMPVRKISIDIWGRDQGWTSNADGGSWTWYDLQLLRPGEQEQKRPRAAPDIDTDVAPTRTRSPQTAEVETETPEPEQSPLIHRLATTALGNKTKATQYYHFIWYPEEAKEEPLEGECPASLMRELSEGSTLQVRALARFPAWVNYVERVHLAAFIAVVH